MPQTKSDRAKARGFVPEELAHASYERNTMPVVNATQYAHNLTTKYFREYLTSVHDYTDLQSSDLFQVGANLPTVQIWKGYLEWLCQGTEGKIDSNTISMRSLETMLYQLQTVLCRSTSRELSYHDGNDILAFIRTNLRIKFGITIETLQKGYADEVDSGVLMEQLWCFDIDEISERYRVQLAFLILLHTHSGLRPGSILPDQHYPGNSLKYEHCVLYLTSGVDACKPQFYLDVSQRNMKGRKNSAEFLTISLTEGDRCCDCPITFFLALAFADDAFEGVSTPEELFRLAETTVRSHEKRKIHFKQSKLAESVFKYEYINQLMSKTPKSDLQYRQFWEQLKDLSRRASYQAHIKRL